MMSKSGVAGYVASFPIPEVVMGINAFTLAAQKVNPNFKVKMIWVNSLVRSGQGGRRREVADRPGRRHFAQHTDSPAVMQTAEARGIHAFGQSSDMARFGPKAQLTAIVDNWAPYCIERVQAVLDGNWKTGSVWWGIKEGMVELAPWGPASRRRRKRRPKDTRRHRRRHAASVRRADQRPVGKAEDRSGANDPRRRPAEDELVRRGRAVLTLDFSRKHWV